MATSFAGLPTTPGEDYLLQDLAVLAVLNLRPEEERLNQARSIRKRWKEILRVREGSTPEEVIAILQERAIVLIHRINVAETLAQALAHAQA